MSFRRRGLVPALILVIALLVLLDQRGHLLAPAQDDPARYEGRSARVTRVIDGDTLEVDLPDRRTSRPRTRVRLIGVDCPEMNAGAGLPEPWAAEATAFSRRLVEGAYVTLLIDPARPRDPYDRLLAHVELPDGALLNRELLAAGLARAEDRWPHARLRQYEQAELIARRAKIGVWSAPAR
ncbi:MAG: thermonuclease family protein [Phycisphaeraceae bacterium]|nr:thermonuclease family protein [Phycisphaerales bacterium]QOJ17566.1 MAG: thermonuclease family protein [Phycisphaeraceae bacterium]